jgi:sulfatase modifying factor 1
MGNNPSAFQGVTNGPVERVSWFNAIEFCNRLSISLGLVPCYSYGTYGTDPSNWPVGWNTISTNHSFISCDWITNGYRLPTEAEWEFAARGGNLSHNYTYSGSNNIFGVAWYTDNSGNSTQPVHTKTENELGIYDLSGNVWEWCWDIYSNYPTGTQTNPHGAMSGLNRVLRGGCWNNQSNFCTVTYRYNNYASFNNYGIGFRLCKNYP